MIRNIIFDWSGTLVDDLPAVWQATNAVLRQAGVPELTLEQFRAEFCLPFQQFYDRFTPHVPLAQLEVWFHEAFRKLNDSVVELPHARSFLEFCRQQRLRCFVLSTVRTEYFLAQTARNGFGSFFERVWLEVRDKRQQIQPLLVEAGLEPSETLFVGDMQHDIDTARHGGLWSCAVLTGYNTLAQLRAAEPDLLVEHLEELRQTLVRHGMHLPAAVGKVNRAFEAKELPAKVAGLVVNPTGQVLLIRSPRWADRWGVPEGEVRQGESAPEAVRRTLKEATSLEVGELELVLVHEPGVPLANLQSGRAPHWGYLCRCADHGRVQLNAEAVEFRWVSLNQARGLPLNNLTRMLLEVVAQRGSSAWSPPGSQAP